MQITFLGTSSMVPTKDRNHSAVFLSYGTEGILFDCGEGTQRQFKIAGISLTKTTKILLTHWHGDHVLGLPGLMQTLSSLEYNQKLNIYGPKDTKKRIESMFEAFIFDKKLDFEVHEVREGKFFENEDFVLEAYQLEHGIEILGFKFVEKDKRKVDMKKAKKLGLEEGPSIGKLQSGHSIEHNGKKIMPDDVSYTEKGKVVAYVTDTLLCEGCYKTAKRCRYSDMRSHLLFKACRKKRRVFSHDCKTGIPVSFTIQYKKTYPDTFQRTLQRYTGTGRRRTKCFRQYKMRI